jgi:hypothetical protein
MKDWIEQNLYPPGIQKKNRGALFSAIGKVFGIVRDDAQAAFNAHFPYLADEKKLAEHGRALGVPRFVNDHDQEYRDRVAAASFYHMKTGERGYIKGQLAAHFGDRFITREDFLQIYLQVLDLTDAELAWAENFLDAIVDPNVSLQFGKRKALTDTKVIRETGHIGIANKTIDTVLLAAVPGIRLKLLFTDEIGTVVRYDGKYQYDGTITYKQNPGFYDAVRVTSIPQNIDRIYHDDATIITLKLLFKDTINQDIRYNGKYQYDGSIKYHGGQSIKDNVSIKTNYTENIREREKIVDAVRSGIALRPIAERVSSRSMLAIQVRKSTLYNGEITYDGSHTYVGYTVEEVQKWYR